ncbi:ferritin-like domain-containing protein [Aestuariivirga sp.]|uniref:YciE/YciF ferroxidase family protein n=1 Tax=Aestuariivirga sp. TaxID=2650926 RepID=UPI0039E31D7B
MKIQSFEDLFQDMLQDIYYVEKKLVKTLPGMAKKATAPDLRTAIEDHLTETEGHVQRLEQVFELLGKTPKAKKCEALEGLIAEAEEVMSEITDKQTLDAAIIASAQAVEHYEIARYGTLCAWAEQLGQDDAADLFEKTLEEEKAADEKLTEIAEEEVNPQPA